MARVNNPISRSAAASSPLVQEVRFAMTGVWTAGLLAGWTLIAAASLMLDSSLSPRFLDLPLGAFLAGQGAVLGLVVVGVRVSRSGR